MSARTPAKGHAAKHVHHRKHTAHKKHRPAGQKKTAAGAAHHVTTVAHHPHHPKPRGLALGDALPVCPFEAVAMSLRLLGQHVADDDVAGLWELAGRPEEGAGIGEALAIVAREGIVSVRPGQFDYRRLTAAECMRRLAGVRPCQLVPCRRLEPGVDLIEDFHALILGINTPGPHAVLATPDGWWSWGELYSPWTATIEEAWAVAWS